MLGPSFSVVAALKVAPSSASGVPVLSRICTPTLVALPAAEFCRGQNGGIAAVDGRTGEGDGRFGGYRSVAIIQLDVETDGRTGAPRRGQFRGTHRPN